MQPHQYWQELHPRGSFAGDAGYADSYPAELGDGRQLLLPIRPLPDGRTGLASLIVNQASFAVLAALADDLVEQLAAARPEIVIGLPTLGLTLASAVAQRLGHSRYVPLGTSRKFWYDEQLSVPLTSITTPEQSKRLYLDPRMLALLEGRRVVLIDDVISTGSSIVAGLSLLQSVGIEPVAIGAAMLQSDRWKERVAAAWPGKVTGVLSTPLLQRTASGLWTPV